MIKEISISITEKDLKSILKNKLNLKDENFEITIDLENTYNQDRDVNGKKVRGLEIIIKEEIK